MFFFLFIVYVCFPATIAELSSFDRDQKTHRYIYYTTIYRKKKMLTPALRDKVNSFIYPFI